LPIQAPDDAFYAKAAPFETPRRTVAVLMQFLMLVVISVSALAVYLSSPQDVHLLPSFGKFLPEVLSLIATPIIVIKGLHQNFRFVSAKYLMVFGMLVVVIACGAFVNQVPPGPILAGMRYYLRAIPFFFVPAVFDFKEKQIKQIFGLVLALSFLQVPIAVYQRYTLATTGHSSGDHVYGTMMASGNLSLFLICELCVAAAMVLRGRLSRMWFVFLFVLFMLPMSINETKITVFALPLGLLATTIVGSAKGTRLKVSFYAVAVLIGGGFIFVPLYDFFNAWNNPDLNHQYRIEDFISNPKALGSYLDTKASVGSQKEAGRVDALVVPLQVLSKDPSQLGFGLGLGNTSKSSLGGQFSGRYEPIYGIYSVETSVATFMLETGVVGAVLVLLLHWLIFRDALYLMNRDQGLVGVLALGWIGTSIIMGAGLFYITLHTSESLSYMFWFFSGMIAAKRTRLAATQRVWQRQAIAA
jgi:hypothetical protein